jgi:hypothetical protein
MNTQIDISHALRHGSFVILLAALLIGISATAGSAQSEEDDVRQAVSEACTVHAIGQGSTTYAVCEAAVTEAADWPDLDPSGLADHVQRVEQAKAEAAAEAAGWPDLDPSGLADHVQRVEQAKAEAAAEAAGWPDLDPSGLTDHVQRVEQAKAEAAD